VGGTGIGSLPSATIVGGTGIGSLPSPSRTAGLFVGVRPAGRLLLPAKRTTAATTETMRNIFSPRSELRIRRLVRRKFESKGDRGENCRRRAKGQNRNRCEYRGA